MPTRTLKDIDTEINARVYPVSDQIKYGVVEYWADALSRGDQGDCEDYVIPKIYAALKAGYPRSDIMIGICKVPPKYEGHGVAIIRDQDTKRQMVLDNLAPGPTYWEDCPYVWVSCYKLDEGKYFEFAEVKHG
jgi:predicted transglutaminase-like cysteine proteinase